ncbi:MAG: alpha-amylase [Gammaproteobacteria bacterium]|nr:alpha-amylase [Gammaproteobacteria bacterium]
MSRCALLWLLAGASAAAADAVAEADYRQRLPRDEVIYFVLPDRFENGDRGNDRGGLAGDRLHSGFDPTSKAFYHGGDLAGLRQHLDYVQSLGATALWLAPIFKNKAVQGGPGEESAAYHGYWVTDFTRVDPHFGTEQGLHQLLDAAHARGLKVYLDIITNHTADVIAYRECTRACPYRSLADYPYTRRGGPAGAPINDGFLGDDAAHQTAENFAHLTRPDWAYTPYVPAGAEHLKVPEWLNDPIYYHNRGDSTFSGESVTYGDFGGLDDLMTEHPRVLAGFIEIYGDWIERFGIDGFRIDTAKHVNPEFWQHFVPAMRARAAARGIPNFHIFGEVSSLRVDPALLARHTRSDALPAVLDFAFALAVRATVAGDAGTDLLAEVFADDVLYEGGEAAALELPTFISNHDDGRFGYFLRQQRPAIADAEALQRVELAYAMLLTLRGVPVVYYGDEQGFAGEGGDQAARQDMFATQVPSYLAERHIGGGTGAGSHFDASHPLYQHIARLSRLRAAQPALRRGLQRVRRYDSAPGIFAVSRFEPGSGRELLIAFNTASAPVKTLVTVEAQSRHFTALAGRCASEVAAPGSYPVELGALEFSVCAAAVAP